MPIFYLKYVRSAQSGFNFKEPSKSSLYIGANWAYQKYYLLHNSIFLVYHNKPRTILISAQWNTTQKEEKIWITKII